MGVVTFKMTSDEAAAVNGFMRLVDAQKKVNTEVAKGGKAGKLFNQGLQGGLNSNIRSLGRMAAGFVGIGTAISVGRSAWRLFQDDIKKGTDSIVAFQKAFVGLQFLGDTYKDPKKRERIFATAKRTGIEAGEIAMGEEGMKSMTAAYLGGKSPAEQKRILAKMNSEVRRLRKTTSSTVPELVPMYAKMRSFYPDLTARGQTNISHKMIEEAAVTSAAEIVPYAPKMFEAGKLGKLSARQAAAFGAFLTSKTGSAADAATASRRIAMKVMLSDPDEAEAIRNLAFGAPDPTSGRKGLMKKAGVSGGDNALDRLYKLAGLNKKSPLSVQALKDIAGERGAGQLNAILNDPEGLKAMVERFETQTVASRDIVGDKLAHVRGTDKTFPRLEAGERGQAAIEAAKQDPDALLWSNLDTSYERIRRETKGGWRTQAFLGASYGATAADGAFSSSGSLADRLTNDLARNLSRYGYLEGVPSGQRETAGTAMAERWLGITKKIEDAAQSLNDAAEKTKNFNAHTN